MADRYNTFYSIAEEVYGELIETVVASRSFILNRKGCVPTVEGDDRILSVLVDFLNKINGLGVNEVIKVLKDLEDNQEMGLESREVKLGIGPNRPRLPQQRKAKLARHRRPN